jgi:hypothetical protein
MLIYNSECCIETHILKRKESAWHQFDTEACFKGKKECRVCLYQADVGSEVVNYSVIRNVIAFGSRKLTREVTVTIRPRKKSWWKPLGTPRCHLASAVWHSQLDLRIRLGKTDKSGTKRLRRNNPSGASNYFFNFAISQQNLDAAGTQKRRSILFCLWKELTCFRAVHKKIKYYIYS